MTTAPSDKLKLELRRGGVGIGGSCFIAQPALWLFAPTAITRLRY